MQQECRDQLIIPIKWSSFIYNNHWIQPCELGQVFEFDRFSLGYEWITATMFPDWYYLQLFHFFRIKSFVKILSN